MADVTYLVTVSKNKNNTNRFDDVFFVVAFSVCFDCLLFSHAFEMLPYLRNLRLHQLLHGVVSLIVMLI